MCMLCATNCNSPSAHSTCWCYLQDFIDSSLATNAYNNCFVVKLPGELGNMVISPISMTEEATVSLVTAFAQTRCQMRFAATMPWLILGGWSHASGFLCRSALPLPCPCSTFSSKSRASKRRGSSKPNSTVNVACKIALEGGCSLSLILILVFSLPATISAHHPDPCSSGILLRTAFPRSTGPLSRGCCGVSLMQLYGPAQV